MNVTVWTLPLMHNRDVNLNILIYHLQCIVCSSYYFKPNIAIGEKDKHFIFEIPASFTHDWDISSTTEGRKSISIFTRSSLPRADRLPWQTPSKSWQLPRRKQKEGSFYLRHVPVRSACRARPSRTQGYPLSLGKIITPRRGNKSTEPGPHSPSATPHLSIGMVMSEAHACWQPFLFFFPSFSFCRPPPFAQLAFQHNCNVKKYSRPLPSRCPPLLSTHWYLNTPVSVKMLSAPLASPGATSILTATRSFTLAFFPPFFPP